MRHAHTADERPPDRPSGSHESFGEVKLVSRKRSTHALAEEPDDACGESGASKSKGALQEVHELNVAEDARG